MVGSNSSYTSMFADFETSAIAPVGSSEVLEVILDPTVGVSGGAPTGRISDPTPGARILATGSPHVFEEVITTGGTLTLDDVLKRLVYTPPNIPDGEDPTIIATVNFFLAPVGGDAFIYSNAVTLTMVDVTPAAIIGAVGFQPDGNMPIKPFNTVSVIDGTPNAADTAEITIHAPIGSTAGTDEYGGFSKAGLTKIGVGTYLIPNAVSPTQLTTILQGLTFTPAVGANSTDASITLSVTDTVSAKIATNTLTTILTPGITPTPQATPVPTPAQTPAPIGCTVEDMSSSTMLTVAATPYNGPVAGLAMEYINVSTDNLNVTATSSNWFVHTGSGTDAIQASSGTNVLDGGTGSNFLTDGSGTDTNFVDVRTASEAIWSSVVNFHSGDSTTIFGISASTYDVATVDGAGTAGFTGLTFHATHGGSPEASLTLAGYSTADLSNGRLTMSYGTEADGTNYLYVHAN